MHCTSGFNRVVPVILEIFWSSVSKVRANFYRITDQCQRKLLLGGSHLCGHTRFLSTDSNIKSSLKWTQLHSTLPTLLYDVERDGQTKSTSFFTSENTRKVESNHSAGWSKAFNKLNSTLLNGFK